MLSMCKVPSPALPGINRKGGKRRGRREGQVSIPYSTATSASCRSCCGLSRHPQAHGCSLLNPLRVCTSSVPVCYLFSRLTNRKGVAQRLLYNMRLHFRKYPMFVHSHMLTFTVFYHVTRVYRGRYQRHRDDQGPVSVRRKSVLVCGKADG